MQLDGKVAVVTGAARGLGRAYVEALAAEGTSEFMGEKHDRAVEIIASGQTLQRNLNTEDLVGAILYLAGGASRSVTGQNIMVDGGTVCL